MKDKQLILLAATMCLGIGTFEEVSNATVNAKTVKYEQVKIKKHAANKHVTNKATKKITKNNNNNKKELKRQKQLSQGDNNNARTQTNNYKNANQSNDIKNGYNYTTNTITDYNQYSQNVVDNMLKLINNYRTANGLSKLSLDNTLTAVANKRAQQNNQWWNESWFDGHNDQNGNFIAGELAKEAGITTTYIGENAGGTPGDGALENPIDASNNQFKKLVNEGPTGGHYQNMMDPKYTKIGIGVYMNQDKNPDIYGGYDEVYSN